VGQQVKQLAVSAALLGDNLLLPATAGVLYRVMAYTLVASAGLVVQWKNGAGGTALSGPMTLVTGIALAPPPNPKDTALIETTAGNALNLNLSVATQVSGHLTYVQETTP
jgi:hypothetical protein